MSFKMTPVKEKDARTFKITPVEKMLEGLLPVKGYQNRVLTTDELWAMGLTMMKTGYLYKFTIKAGTKTLVLMEAPTPHNKYTGLKTPRIVDARKAPI